tara:strand:- start:529 stop:1755 length:1227 start_codon:yes stop_codon:yes gene_type:complete
MSSVEENTLPKGWVSKKMSEICSKITDGTHKTPKYVESGVRFISIKNIKPFSPIDWDAYVKYISIEEHNQLSKRCNPEVGDILFPRIGTLGYAKIIDWSEEVSLFVGLGLAKPIKEEVCSFYLEYFLNSPFVYTYSHLNATGSGRKTLALKSSKEIPVPLPPLEEQKRIVAKIDGLFAKIDKAIALTEESLTQAKNLLPSLLAEVFSTLSIKNKLVELSELCDFKNGFAFKSKEFNKVGNGVQVLRIGNVLDIGKNPVFIEEKDAFRDYILNENDIVVSMTGTRLKKDYLFVRVIKNEPFYLNQRVGKISSKPFTYYRYIYFYLKSDFFRSEVFKYETGAVNQGNISGKAIMKMLIPKVDIVTQKEIANKCLEISNQSKDTQQKLEEQLAYLKQLKSSILTKAFKGEL